MSADLRQLRSSAERFDERASDARRRPWRRAGSSLVAVVVLAVIGWTVGWSPLFQVRTVQVSGVEGTEAAEVLELAGVAKGEPMIRFDPEPVRQRVSVRPTVAGVSVERSWPSTIVVRVTPRTAVLVVKSEGDLRLVDESGLAYLVVSKAPAGLPTVSATGTRAVTPEALRAAVAVQQSLPESLSSKVSGISVSSADLVTLKLKGTSIIWGGPADADTKVSVVAALLPTKPTTIDVSVPGRPVTTGP